MKILLLNSFYYPNTNGGAEFCVRSLAEHLVQRGNDVSVLTLGNSDEEKEINGVHVKYITTYLYKNRNSTNILIRYFAKLLFVFDFVDYFKFKKSISHSYDIVHTHDIHIMSPIVWLVIKNKKMPIIHTMHDRYLLCSRLFMLKKNGVCDRPNLICRIRRLLMKCFVKWVNEFVSPSFDLRNSMPVDATVINNGINLIASNNKKYSHKNPFTIVFLGGYDEHKGIDIVLDAIPMINRDVKIIIAGRGELKKALFDYENVKYMGLLTEDEISELLENAEALLCASICPETFPTVVLHAFNHGIPVIAPESSGYIELIKNRNTGVLFRNGDSTSLAEVVNSLYDDLPKYQIYLDTIQIERNKYNIERYVDLYEKEYKKFV